jgi:prolyl oligopeptidase
LDHAPSVSGTIHAHAAVDMKVSFIPTISEAGDGHLLSRACRIVSPEFEPKLVTWGLVLGCLSLCAAIVAVVYAIFFRRGAILSTVAPVLVVGAITAAAGACAALLAIKRVFRTKGLATEVALLDHGVCVTTVGTSQVAHWSAIRRVLDDNANLWIDTKDTRTFVPARAFGSPLEREAWFAALRVNVDASRFRDPRMSPAHELSKPKRLAIQVSFGILSALLIAYLSGREQPQTAHPAPASDPHDWLKPDRSQRALEWVTQQNRTTLLLMSSWLGKQRRSDGDNAATFDSQGQVMVARAGKDFLMAAPIDPWGGGAWRRFSWPDLERPSDQWPTLIDVPKPIRYGQVGDWRWHGVNCERERHTRCLVALADGEGKAWVFREFDLTTRQWVRDGFGHTALDVVFDWIDADHLLVTTRAERSIGASSDRTAVRRWSRGEPFERAAIVFEGTLPRTPMIGYVTRTWGMGGAEPLRWGMHQLTRDAKRWFDEEGKLRFVEAPGDADVRVHGPHIFVTPARDWTIGGRTYLAGSVLVTELDDYTSGRRDFATLFAPTHTTALAQTGPILTRSHVVLNLREDMRHRLVVVKRQGSRWEATTLDADFGWDHVWAQAFDDLDDDEVWLWTEGFLSPKRLLLYEAGADFSRARKVHEAPRQFDTSGLRVEQYFAVSKDGTRIPYFVVAMADRPRDGSTPMLMKVYGGFGVTQQPRYDERLGRWWLQRGGGFVLPGLRGGQEYGPAWYHAAVRGTRERIVEDAVAVAADLTERGHSSPKRLALYGGSAGAVIAGTLLTRYPGCCAAVVLEDGVLDLDVMLRAGPDWSREYGNPRFDWDTMKQSSPYHLVQHQPNYPPTLVMTSRSDRVVHAAHGRRMVAALQEAGQLGHLFETDGDGHGGPAYHPNRIRKDQLRFDFLWYHTTRP